MAREQWHNWARNLFLAAVIIFTSGGWVIKVINNTEAIKESKKEVMNAYRELAKEDEQLWLKAEKTGEEIVSLKLQYKDMQGLTNAINESLQGIKAGQKVISDGQIAANIVQNKMVTDVAVISEKIKTLTKGD